MGGGCCSAAPSEVPPPPPPLEAAANRTRRRPPRRSPLCRSPTRVWGSWCTVTPRQGGSPTPPHRFVAPYTRGLGASVAHALVLVLPRRATDPSFLPSYPSLRDPCLLPPLVHVRSSLLFLPHPFAASPPPNCYDGVRRHLRCPCRHRRCPCVRYVALCAFVVGCGGGARVGG